MSSADNEQELVKRLRELEEENARLRNSSKSNKITITEGEYKGHPTLTFEGPFRSFTLGLSKLKAIKDCWPKIEDFIRRHTKDLQEIKNGDENIKI